MDFEKIVQEIDAEIGRLQKARDLLSESSAPKKAARSVKKVAASKKWMVARRAAGRHVVVQAKKSRFKSDQGERVRKKPGTGDGGYGFTKSEGV